MGLPTGVYTSPGWPTGSNPWGHTAAVAAAGVGSHNPQSAGGGGTPATLWDSVYLPIISSGLEYLTGKKNYERQVKDNRINYRNRYQWQMEDMKKAGLNPILSANTGAPVPQGGGLVPGNDFGLAEAGNFKLRQAATNSAIGLQRSQTANVNADTGVKITQADKTGAEANLTRQLERESVSRQGKMASDMNLTTGQLKHIEAQIAELNSRVPVNHANSARAHAEAVRTESGHILGALPEGVRQVVRGAGGLLSEAASNAGRNLGRWAEGVQRGVDAATNSAKRFWDDANKSHQGSGRNW